MGYEVKTETTRKNKEMLHRIEIAGYNVCFVSSGNIQAHKGRETIKGKSITELNGKVK